VPETIQVKACEEEPVPNEERDEFERLYRGHVDAVFAYAIARTTPELAKEAVEETFLVAWRRLADVPEEPRAWLCGVARRVLANQWRARDRRGALGLRIMASGAFVSYGADPADEVAERQRTLAALCRLSESDRELLCLTAWGELSADKAARVLGCSKATMLVRLHRARRRFESALGAEDEPLDPPEAPVGTSGPHQPTHQLL
jgi:RNA polymerase sigma-70 factor, ECF subfamily